MSGIAPADARENIVKEMRNIMMKDWSNRSLKENEYVPRPIILSGRHDNITFFY